MSRPKPTVDLGYPTEAHGSIPAFNSVEEEAEFWDTHDFTDFIEESTPVEITVGEALVKRLTVRLDEGDSRELARRARSLGVSPSTLARIWLKERLSEDAEAEAPAR
jgi:hypothetical protein